MKGYIDLEQFKSEVLGKRGTPERDQYDYELQLDILGYLIRQTRKERRLTQAQLGDLLGVQRAEISKLERNARNMTIGTVLKVFRAMEANVRFNIVLDEDAEGLSLTR